MRLSECGGEVEECHTGSQGLGTVKLLNLQIDFVGESFWLVLKRKIKEL
jgi:hypothetical protein